MKSRPEYVVCALMDTWEGEPPRPTYLTWCGQRTGNVCFTFSNANHALLEGKRGGRLLLCPQCAKEIKLILERVSAGENE